MFIRTFAAAMLTYAVAYPATAAESVTTPTQGIACKTIRSDPEFSESRCPGPSGYSLWIEDAVTRIGVAFIPHGQKEARLEDDLSWAPAKTGVGSQIEWRISNGHPYAAILDTWRQSDETQKTVEEILVVKVSQSGSCRIGTISAQIPDAMNVARKLADRLAETFQCGRNNSLVQSDPLSDSATAIDGQIGQREALDHNGSLMTLTRSDDGGVEIQYQSPRAGLSVASGTILFRGHTDNTGHLTGVAYTFKLGCDPAAYAVRGEKTAGGLVLTGAAPERARASCAIIGTSNNSANSRLVFQHEGANDSR